MKGKEAMTRARAAQRCVTIPAAIPQEGGQYPWRTP